MNYKDYFNLDKEDDSIGYIEDINTKVVRFINEEIEKRIRLIIRCMPSSDEMLKVLVDKVEEQKNEISKLTLELNKLKEKK